METALDTFCDITEKLGNVGRFVLDNSNDKKLVRAVKPLAKYMIMQMRRRGISMKVPDLEWYRCKSEAKGLPTRCPFATVEVCPRFYQSLSLLGYAGSTKINPNEDDRLLEKWQSSDLWPKTKEQATSISGPKGNPKSYTKFCPEVAFERFGLFASTLILYGDDIDCDTSHAQLGADTTVKNDWRWQWASVETLHYVDCPLYAILSKRQGLLVTQELTVEPWYRRPLGIVVLGLIVTVLGGLVVGLLL